MPFEWVLECLTVLCCDSVMLPCSVSAHSTPTVVVSGSAFYTVPFIPMSGGAEGGGGSDWSTAGEQEWELS